MERQELLEKIKSKGYWEINLRPVKYQENKYSYTQLKSMCREAVVELRGWAYPHYGDRNGEPVNAKNGIEKCTDAEIVGEFEFWRMTKSGNFYHLLALSEDHSALINKNFFTRGKLPEGQTVLSVWNTLYTLSEVYEFAKRLALKDVFGSELYIDIKLVDIKGRELVVDDLQKVPFSYARKSNEHSWENEIKNFKTKDFINSSSDYSFEAFIDLMALFQWDNPPISNLKDDQLKFLRTSNTTGIIPEIFVHIDGQANKGALSGRITNDSGRQLVIEQIEVNGIVTPLNRQVSHMTTIETIGMPEGLFDLPVEQISFRIQYRTLDGKRYIYEIEATQEPRADERFNIIFPNPPNISAL